MKNRPDPPDAEQLIRAALEEDLSAPGDITTRALCAPAARSRARIQAKAGGVIAGLETAAAVFRLVDGSCSIEALSRDGADAGSGEMLMNLEGPAAALLTAERTALNLLGRLSGIATLTRAYVEAVRGTGAQILDTRKTTPGLRALEKYAVRCGGGINHRSGLYDMFLIKENHIAAAGGLGPALQRCRRFRREKGLDALIEVEVSRLEQVSEAIESGADIILLDNMTAEQISACVVLAGGRVPLEASGNVNLANVRDIALTGVNRISIGALTHSAPALDISMMLL